MTEYIGDVGVFSPEVAEEVLKATRMVLQAGNPAKTQKFKQSGTKVPLLFRNASGETIPAFGVFTVDGIDVIGDEPNEQPRFEANKCDGTGTLTTYLNSGRDVQDGESGFAQEGDFQIAKGIWSYPFEVGEGVSVIPDEWKLGSRNGVNTDWQYLGDYTFTNAAADDRLMMVKRSSYGIRFGTTQEAIQRGGSGSVLLTGFEAYSPAEEVEAYLEWLTQEQVSDGKEVMLYFDGVKYVIIGAECEDGSTTQPDVVLLASSGSQTQSLTTTFSPVQNLTVEFESGTGAISPTVSAGSPTISYSYSWGSLIVGTAISASPTIAGGTPSFSYAVTAGSLPAGLAISSSTGVISGTPTAASSGSFTVTVTDGNASTGDTGGIAWTVTAPVAFTIDYSGFSWSNLMAGFPMNAPANVSGGSSPIAYAILTGSLPSGVSLNAATGDISGTPTASMTSGSFSVRATDSTSATADSPVYNWQVM